MTVTAVIGVARERATGERRVAVTPETCRKLVAAGAVVRVERGAGQGARVRGEAFAGYMRQDYEGITFDTVSTFTYGGSLAFLLAPRWTGVVEGKRDALESALNGGVSVIESLVAARLDYQVMPNFIVGAGASYLVDEFLSAGRTDRSISPLVSVKYLATPNITLGFDYRNVSFDSSGLGVSTYYRNVYLFSLNARL